MDFIWRQSWNSFGRIAGALLLLSYTFRCILRFKVEIYKIEVVMGQLMINKRIYLYFLDEMSLAAAVQQVNLSRL